MNKSVYDRIISSSSKKICVLIDPDKHDDMSIKELVVKADRVGVDFFMIGSSLLSQSIEKDISIIKNNSKIPLILFPGNLLQLSFNVDAILFLSLISGRNSDLLIGKHVESAPIIKKSGLETISTAYILVESGITTSVQYMSDTKPIPADKPDIAIATAQAGELLGMKLVYLEAGSGAINPVSAEMIKAVKSNIDIPLIVGGGLRNSQQIENACKAGADIIVVGNVLEEDSMKLAEFVSIVHKKY